MEDKIEKSQNVCHRTFYQVLQEVTLFLPWIKKNEFEFLSHNLYSFFLSLCLTIMRKYQNCETDFLRRNEIVTIIFLIFIEVH